MRLGKILEILKEGGIDVVSNEPNGGGYVPCLCPFAPYLHERGVDTNPSFFVKVNPEGLSGFHCFTCKQKGRMSSLFRKLEYYSGDNHSALSIRCALEEIPSKFGDFEDEGEPKEQRQPIVEETYENLYLPAYECEEAANYLRGRDVSEKTALLIGLRYDSHENRILFPVRGRRGELYGYSGRTILKPIDYPYLGKKKYGRIRDYSFDKEQCLLGEQLHQRGKPIFIVEGLFAFAHLVEIGAREVCNPMATLGANCSEEQRDLLIDLDEIVYLCYDNDAGGELGTFGPDGESGAVKLLKSHLPTRLALYPEHINDPDNFTIQDFRTVFSIDYETVS